MLYRQRKDTYIRIYDNIGYIINNILFNDRVTDNIGALFLRALSRTAKEIDTITEEIIESFIDVNKITLKEDIIEFYSDLEEDGFIISGNTIEELDNKDTGFSYHLSDPKTIYKDYTPIVKRTEKETQEYLEEYFKDKPHLRSFQIEITSRCNEYCLHCYIPHEKRFNDIETELFINVIKQCQKMGVINITISGGEPLLHKNFCEFIQIVKDHDIYVHILSNMTLLNDEIIAALKVDRISSVQVSLYSLDPNIHDSITKLSGSFLKTKNSILKLIENDIPVRISCPMMVENKNCYADVLEWAFEHKISAVTDYIMMARFDGTKDNLDHRLNLNEVENVINDIINHDRIYKDRLDFSYIESLYQKDQSNDIVCGVCTSSMCMVSNGNVYPCPGWQSYILGNVKESSLHEIWEKSPKIQYLRSLRKRDFSKCLTCEDRGFCSMCMVRNANEDPDGNLFNINEHFCKVAAINRKIVMDWKQKQNKPMEVKTCWK